MPTKADHEFPEAAVDVEHVPIDLVLKSYFDGNPYSYAKTKNGNTEEVPEEVDTTAENIPHLFC